MARNTLRNLEYLKQNYKPEEIQMLLDSRETKREVYQEFKVSEYVLDNYMKQYKLTSKKRQKPLLCARYFRPLNKELRQAY